ncbi:MAG: peptidoglycan DD-metalloendopeptidase family protein [Deltaproteobacteria bacterium]|nr:peptidoglycan DD-metalloendopeptidase family protein [Deltaproteobacteria bacterium]MBW2658817.1 peptidoglycan DD-metalloendopeptidase family protein [Deltaproteobacteria bacterium]
MKISFRSFFNPSLAGGRGVLCRKTVLSACLSLLMSLLLSVFPLYCLGKKNSTSDDISGVRIKINRLKKGINTQEKQVQSTEDKERNLLLELEVLDRNLTKQQSRLEELEDRMNHQLALISVKSEALKSINAEKQVVEQHLGKRIRAYYTMGGIGFLNVTFSTKSLPELLQFHDAFDKLILYDQNVIKVYLDTINDLERVKNALTLEKTLLQDFIDQVINEKKEVTLTKNEKKNLLLHIKTQTKLHKQAIAEMQEAADALSKSLVLLKKKNKPHKKHFLDQKGKLPPPVNGVIVTLFNQEKVNKLGISRKSSGITLRVDDGTKIRAVGDGTLVFSGYLRGYGNTIIIHHGQDYYTVTSRIEKLLGHKDDTVKKGDVIGITGDTATLFDEGLYFEIRHGKKSLDPLLWLDPGKVVTAAE